MALSQITSASIADGSIVNADISSVAGIVGSKLGTGTVLQVVNATNSTQYTTTASSLTAGPSISITPTSATSKILVLFNMSTSINPGNNTGINQQLYRNGGQILNFPYTMYDSMNSGGQRIHPTPVMWLDNPATTSSVTYQMYIGSNQVGVGVYYNQYGTSVLTLMEIGQ